MAFKEELAIRIREQLRFFSEDFTEKRMFVGLSFLYQGKMTVGIIEGELAVRVISHKIDETLKSPHARPMDFTKRPMNEFVYISEDGIKTEAQLLHFIELGLEHAKSKI